MHTSFLSHLGGRYFWFSLGLMVVCTLLYLFHEPMEAPNGGTWLGYGLGTVGALMILWLAYLGRRKRNFKHGWGTVRGWVSAHVYFGASLLVVATLHTGFQFGWNIHTMAFVLMCLVIFSGFFGIYAYRIFPGERNDLKSSQTLDDIFLLVEEQDSQLQKLVSSVSEEVRRVVSSSIERTVIGGGYRNQLLGRDGSLAMIEGKVVPNVGQQAALDYLIDRMNTSQGDEREKLGDIVGAFSARKRLLDTIREDIRMQAVTSIWLMFHIPITFALIAALTAHVFSVFVYW